MLLTTIKNLRKNILGWGRGESAGGCLEETEELSRIGWFGKEKLFLRNATTGLPGFSGGEQKRRGNGWF